MGRGGAMGWKKGVLTWTQLQDLHPDFTSFSNLSPPLPTWISLGFAKASKSDRPSIIHHSEAAPPVQLQPFLYLHNSLQSPAHLLSRTPSTKPAVNNIRLC